MSLRHLILPIGLAAAPAVATAHPHVYIDAGVTLKFDAAGHLTEIGVSWAYDELYSLLIISDYALDSDGDGKLTQDEQSQIQGFDSDWPEDAAGGLYLSVNGQPVPLGPPNAFQAEYLGGKLISRHIRPLAEPLAMAAPLSVQVYDPEYYVDFAVPEPPQLVGRDDCRVSLTAADPTAAPSAYRKAVEAMFGKNADMAEADIITVDIGAAGSDMVTITCGEGNTE